jgi:DNA gyrase subunit B
VLSAKTGSVIQGVALEELARDYLLTEAVIGRINHLVPPDVLHAVVAGNIPLSVADQQHAEASAKALSAVINHGTRIVPHYDEAHERWQLRIERMHHGNLKLGRIDEDFLTSGDYGQLRKTAEALAGLNDGELTIARGEKSRTVSSFADAMTWLFAEVERGIAKQRYKGLGEMNPEQLWETTMNPKVRRLLKVQIEDAINADAIFTTLMGEQVEPRRAFIEDNALHARNIDV